MKKIFSSKKKKKTDTPKNRYEAYVDESVKTGRYIYENLEENKPDNVAFETEDKGGYFTYVEQYDGNLTTLEESVDPDDLLEEDDHQASEHHDWNHDFQEIMSMKDSREKFEKLRSLEHDFVHAAKTYGRIIISEHSLPLKEKTLQPVVVGGVAGGEKYIHKGILFKFSIDSYNLYGGDENAMKASSHELKGLQNLFQANVAGLHFPLMALIDYLGYRLMAMSLLPIDKSTLVYGSEDAGRTVHMENPKLNSLIQEAAQILNLKKHVSGKQQPKEIYTCADLEGHYSSVDKRFYLVDFARIAPPEPPTARGSHLYKLFRMEFVREYDMPLCSDTFSPMAQDNSEKHVEDINKAQIHLLSSIIPKFANNLEKEVSFPELKELAMEFHKNGINMRHIGYIRSLVKRPEIKKLLLVESIARVCKQQLRRILRGLNQRTGRPTDDIFRKKIVEFLNLVIGRHPKSIAYWKNFLKEDLETHYTGILSSEEKQENHPFEPAYVDMNLLMNRILESMNIVVSPICKADLKRDPSCFRFVSADIVELQVGISHLNLVDYADGMTLYYEATLYSNDYKTRRRLLTLAEQKLSESLRSFSTNYGAMVQLAVVYEMTAVTEVEKNLEGAKILFDKSIQLCEKVLEHRVDPETKKEAQMSLIQTLYRKTKHVEYSKTPVLERGLDLCKKLSQEYADDSELLTLWSKLLYLEGERSDKNKKELFVQSKEKMTGALKNAKVLNSRHLYAAAKIEQSLSDVEEDPDESKKLRQQAAEYFQQSIEKDARYRDIVFKGFKKDSGNKIWKFWQIGWHSPVIREKIEEILTTLEDLTLASLDLREHQLLVDMLKASKSIEQLMIEKSKVEEKSLAELASVLPKLKKLKIHMCDFPDSYFLSLKNIFQQLVYLDFSRSSNLSKDGFTQIFEHKMPLLESLILKEDQVDDKALEKICGSCPKLSKLDLSKTIVEEPLRIIEGSKVPLLSLYLEGCSNIKESDIENHKVASLEVLNLRKTTSLALEDIQHMRSSYPSLSRYASPKGKFFFFWNESEPLKLTYYKSAMGSWNIENIPGISQSLAFLKRNFDSSRDISVAIDHPLFSEKHGWGSITSHQFSLTKSKEQTQSFISGNVSIRDIILGRSSSINFTSVSVHSLNYYQFNTSFPTGKNYHINIQISDSVKLTITDERDQKEVLAEGRRNQQIGDSALTIHKGDVMEYLVICEALFYFFEK